MAGAFSKSWLKTDNSSGSSAEFSAFVPEGVEKEIRKDDIDDAGKKTPVPKK